MSRLALIVVCLSFAVGLTAEEPQPEWMTAPEGSEEWFRDAKFGLFIHWGPVSLVGTEIGWSRGGERRGMTGKGNVPVDVYDNLYKKFNPTEFDAKEWVQIAKDAGMRYLVFTTRHHDGFSMFDSKLTDYKITKSPFGRDVTAELAKACHEAGLRLGFYHSPPDWYHPDYRTERHARFIEFLHGQVRELCTNYGNVDILWFDGLGGSAKDWGSEEMIPMIRKLQPGILINNRAGLPCDFDTPEQRVGKYQTDRLWESCITICRQWAWKPNDTMKSLQECIQTLVRCAGGDGNLLFNVGPMPNGEIEPRQVERLREMGAWLQKNGESIYATRGGPFRPGRWGASTRKGSRIYLHVFEWDGDSVVLPAIAAKIARTSVLGGGTARIEVDEESLEVTVAPKDRHEIDTVVVLELDRSAADVPSVGLSSGSLAEGRKATASNVYQGMTGSYGPVKAIDDDDATRWATDAGTRAAWLEVDLGKAATFDRARILEAIDDRVQEFELQARSAPSGDWKTFAKGTTIGESLDVRFEPVTARFVRLDILKATDGPTIWEFLLFPPKKK